MAEAYWDDRRQRLLDWLCGDRPVEGQSQSDFARDVLGVDPSRVSHWKSEPEFLERWDAEMRSRAGHPERLAEQLDRLHSIAVDKRTERDSDRIRAIEQYWKLLGKASPPEREAAPELTESNVASLSDAELQKAALELGRRSDG